MSSIFGGRKFDQVRPEEDLFDAARKVDGPNVGVRGRRILKQKFDFFNSYFFGLSHLAAFIFSIFFHYIEAILHQV